MNMDLHNRLKELNNLPGDQALKSRVYEEIQQNKKSSLGKWKEAFLLIAIAIISLFLVIVPESMPQNQTTPSSIQAIYKYFDGKEGKFFARSSSLYLSVHKVDDPNVYLFFENFSQYVKQVDGKLGNYITDVVVVRDREEEHYQVSETDILHVDTGKFYQSDSELYNEVFNSLYSVNINVWFILFPIMTTFVHILGIFYYKVRNIKENNPYKNSWWLFAVVVVTMMAIFAWAQWVGPLYKPLVIVFALLYGAMQWYILKQNAQTDTIYKVEVLKIIIFIFTILFLIVLY